MIRSYHDKRKLRTSGFTILELLVAIVISAILLALLSQILNHMIRTSIRNNDLFQAVSAGNGVLDLIVQDIDSLTAIQIPYNSEFLQTLPNPQLTNGTQSMFLLLNSYAPLDSYSISGSYTTASSDRGQVRSILYGIAYQDPVKANGNAKLFGLYRTTVSAQATFTYMLGTSNLFSAFSSLPSSAFESGMNPLATTYTPIPNDLIADNVIDLEVSIFLSQYKASASSISYGPPILANAPANSTSTYQKVQLSPSGTSVSGTFVTGTTGANGFSSGSPAYLEISVTVLDESGARLWGNGSGTGALSPASLKAKYGRVFTRIIPIRFL